MFIVTNLSSNTLVLSDGKSLASGDNRKIKTIGDSEQKFENRGWLSIIEEAKEEKADGGKSK